LDRTQEQKVEDPHRHHAGHQHTQQQNNPAWYDRHQYEVHDNSREQLEHEKKVSCLLIFEIINIF
jgi:hypothetical protein